MASQHMQAEDGVFANGQRAGRADILFVGTGESEIGALPSRLFGALGKSIVGVDYDMLDTSSVAEVMAIASPVVSEGFDAVELAARLQSAGFRGRYVAYAEDDMSEAVIKADVAQVAPDVAFDLIRMDRKPHLA